MHERTESGVNNLRVLLVHNFYGTSSPSGENQVFNAEKSLLETRGHEIREFTRHSDVIRAMGVWGAAIGAASTPWNPIAASEIKRTINLQQSDVVHVHNTFPMLSPAVFHSIGHTAARVITLHNYRLFCPAAIPMRNGKVCIDCLDRRSVLPSLIHGCYRDSRLATLPLAASVALHRVIGTWKNQVDAFIALTDFQRVMMIEAGLPSDLVHVKPNFYPGQPAIVPWRERRKAVVFAGRLTAEKGVLALVKAWLKWGEDAPELRIVGDGDLRGEIEQLIATSPTVKIQLLGQLTSVAAQDEIARASLLVLPSEWFEGFPMVVREAFAFGTPAAVSNIGPLPSIVCEGENGTVFEPANPDSLLKTVQKVWYERGELERLSGKARESFEALYTENANYKTLMMIYEQAIQVSKRRKLGRR